MKRKISILMSAVMMLSLAPVSSFAESFPNVETVGMQEVSTTDSNKEVRLKISLGKFLDLKTGRVVFELENTKLAKDAMPATISIYQGSTMLASDTATFLPTNAKFVGGEELFTLDVAKEVKADNVNDIYAVVNLKLDFTDSKVGDAKVSVRDLGNTGIGNHNEKPVTEKAKDVKDIDVKVQKADSKIGPAGGELGKVLVYQLAKLSDNEANNKIVYTLPSEFSINPSKTKVLVDDKDAKVSFSRDYSEMTITGVSSKNSFVSIAPVVNLKASSKERTGNVIAGLDFISNGKIVAEKDVAIGSVISYGFDLVANEKGSREIPTLVGGIAKTVELQLNAVEGTFTNGSVVKFDVENANILFGTLKVVQGDVTLSAANSAGISEGRKVAGYEVYANNSFAVRTTKSDVKNIKVVFDVVSTSDKKTATVTASAKNMNDTTIDIAKIQKSIAVEVMPVSVEKGKISDSPQLVIKESAARQLSKGDKVTLELVYPGSTRDEQQKIVFENEKDIEIVTTSSLVVEKYSLSKDGRKLELVIGANSRTNPGTITIKNLKLNLSEKAPENEVKIKTLLNGNPETEAVYFFVGKPVRLTTVFTIGSKDYTQEGQIKTLVTAPYVNNGRTMLPVRAVAESLGLTATWDNATKTATFKNDKTTAVVKVGASVMTVNNTPMKLTVPAEIKDGSVMIELRSLASAFVTDISWNAKTKTVTVN